MRAGATSLVLEDALRCRQEALTIYNAINGTSMWVELSESAAGIDYNGDGMVGSDDTQEQETNMDTTGGESEDV
jgi:hypothetical protein